MKLGPITKASILVGIACFALIAIRVIDAIPARRLAALVGVSIDIVEPTPKLIVVKSEGAVTQSVISELSRSAVAVQTFFKSSLVRSGSGVVVSSDGLILTTAVVAPYGSGSFAYQVATSSGSLLQARGVWRRSGLVLLKVEASDLSAVFFDSGVPLRAGQPLVAVGARVSLSRYVPVILPITMPYFTESDIPISVDRSFASLINGARIEDARGGIVGLFVYGSPISHMISAKKINGMVNEYLATIKK